MSFSVGTLSTMVDSSMGTHNPGGSPGTGSFSCFHGEDRRPPIDPVTLTDQLAIIRRIEEFYAEAARLLPLEEMPDLTDCIYAGGHCFGLADPVSNIILNAVGLLPDREEGPHADRHKRFRSSYNFWLIASSSFNGLLAFMTYYFRYISQVQARRYVYLASFDLRLAISLVHHDRFMSSESLPELLPDEGKMKAALRVAAMDAKHPAPDVLAQLMTAKYSGYTLHTLNDWLRQRKQPLSVNQVYKIKNFLAGRWPPSAPPPASIRFWCRPNGGTCKRLADGTLLITSNIGNDLVAQVSIKHSHQSISFPKYICNWMLCNADVETRLPECLAVVARCRGGKPRVRDDDSPCEHLLSLKLCLLDTIHGFYIKALAILPSYALSANLIRSLLVAGHCYGPLDPVSNIILNSVWYDTAFPVASGVELPQDILDTIHMARMESRSLDGLVATLGHNSMKHEAFEQIFSSRCNLSEYPLPEFTGVAKAAKHPQYAACGSFLNSLSSKMLAKLRFWLSAPPGDRLASSKWNKLKMAIGGVCHVLSVPKEAPCSLLPYTRMEMSRTRERLMSTLSFVRTNVDPILREYCCQHPWESNFKLDIICGVTLSSSSYLSNVYHVNFLATPEDAEKNERILFFAEFWVPVSSKAPPNPPCCCPLKNYFQFTGRCSFCEAKGSKVVHPASGGHFADTGGFGDLFCPDADNMVGSDFKQVLDADYTYFEPDRDAELAKIINSIHPHEYNAVHLMLPVPSLSWKSKSQPFVS